MVLVDGYMFRNKGLGFYFIDRHVLNSYSCVVVVILSCACLNRSVRLVLLY